MKLSIPTLAAGKIIMIPAALPPTQKERKIIDPTPEQLADIASGLTYWTPSEDGKTGVLSVPPAKPLSESARLNELNAAFTAAVPPELQPAFAQAYAVVRVLVQAGQLQLAAGVVSGLEVPAELEAGKAQILTLLS
jgi:hypothetical protein